MAVGIGTEVGGVVGVAVGGTGVAELHAAARTARDTSTRTNCTTSPTDARCLFFAQQ